MNLKQKLKEAEEFQEQIRSQQLKCRTELERLLLMEQQVIGRITTYKEILDSEPATEQEPPVHGWDARGNGKVVDESVAGDVIDIGQSCAYA